MPQQLSSKDASLFRQVVRHYENKQHKKGGFGDLNSLFTVNREDRERTSTLLGHDY